MRGSRSTWAIAAAVGVAVAAIAVVLLLHRADDGVSGPARAEATGPMSIWPESALDDAEALQRARARVEAGHDAWRLDPEARVSRFAQDVFGWHRIATSPSPVVPPGPVRVRPVCAGGCTLPTSPVDVSLDRIGGAGRMWSVVAATSPGLRLPVASGATVRAGQDLAFDLRLREGDHAVVGLRFAAPTGAGVPTACGDGSAVEADVTGAHAVVTVPARLFADPSCASVGATGYVFAYVTPSLTVQTGDPLLEPAAISGLAIVPVRVVPAGAPSSA